MSWPASASPTPMRAAPDRLSLTSKTMTDSSGSRTPRDDGAEEQNSLTVQFRHWLRTMLGGRDDTTLRDAIEELIEERPAAEDSIAADERVLITNILKLRDRTVD